MTGTVRSLANGLRTRILDTGGDGVPLVLVHGLANSLEIWSRVLPALAERHRVVAFDLPGFGEASRPDAAYDSTFFVDQVRALLDTMEIDRAMLIGSSLGASVIVHFAAANLWRVEKAVLAAPGGFGRATHPLMRLPALPLVGSWLGRPTPSNNRLTLRLAMHDPRQVTPELIALTDHYAAVPGSARSLVRTLQSGVGLRGSRHLDQAARAAARLDRPSLLLWGRQDRVFPVRHAEAAARLLPHATLRLIDRCGHYPHWEQPEQFAHAVLGFVA